MAALGAYVAWTRRAPQARRWRGRVRALAHARSRSASRSRASPPCSPGSGWSRCCAGAGAGRGRRRRPGRAPAWSRSCSSAGPRPATSRATAASTSGHAALVKGGLELADDRPIAGWGSGAFGRAFYDQIEKARDDRLALRADHRRRRAGRDRADRSTRRCSWSARWSLSSARGASGSPARTAVAACFVAMIGRQPRLHGVRDRSGDLGAARAGRRAAPSDRARDGHPR